MLTLLLLTALLLSLSTSAYDPFSAFSNQRALAPDTDVPFSIPPPPLPYPPIWIRCPSPSIWKCFYTIFFGQVSCHCVFEPLAEKGKPAIGSQAKEKHNRTLEIVTELQPGNDQTRISFFRLKCEEENFAGCVSDGKQGFECGCHEGKGRESVVEEEVEELEDGYGTEAELKIRRVGESRVEKSAIKRHRDFPFRGVRFPRCTKIGYSIKCRGRECFCGPDDVHISPDDTPNPPDDSEDPPQ